jgi:transcriptional regulator with XRE-family HTH domain
MIVEIKAALASQVRQMRGRKRWSQKKLADRMSSSQSRIAKLEAADPSVSVELMIRSLATMGASLTDVGQILSGKRRTAKRVTEKLLGRV